MFFIFIHTVFVFFFWHFSWDFGITFFGKVAKVKFWITHLRKWESVEFLVEICEDFWIGKSKWKNIFFECEKILKFCFWKDKKTNSILLFIFVDFFSLCFFQQKKLWKSKNRQKGKKHFLHLCNWKKRKWKCVIQNVKYYVKI